MNATKSDAGFGGVAIASQKQFFGRSREITDQQKQMINDLTAEPYILEEERSDIESFIGRFPLLWKNYIPISIIGEGMLIVCRRCLFRFNICVFDCRDF